MKRRTDIWTGRPVGRRILLPALLSTAVLAGGAVLAGESPAAKDWPLFRGNPGQTGVARGALPERLEVLWVFEAADGFEGAAAVSAGRVFAASAYPAQRSTTISPSWLTATEAPTS